MIFFQNMLKKNLKTREKKPLLIDMDFVVLQARFPLHNMEASTSEI